MAIAKKKIGKKADLRKVTRLVTLGIFIGGLGLSGLTAWFIMHTLNEIATVQSGTANADFKVEGINVQLLDRLLEAQLKKTSPDGDELPKDVQNPFRKTPLPLAPAPAPSPAPSPAPEVPPPPAPTS